ncbi:MAG: DUF3332 domain-containing protein [Prevotella sp.]|jgi:hypothetical protein|nr:DUF3332 domain-containing protein [Prevotella sp.]MBR1620980.1 DUF3332 domain-containing protein [Prevotella sp.]
MKKFNLKVAAILLSGTILFSSCVGSFSLFNTYARWQTHMTDNKYVNGIVGIILLPIVGSVTLLADAVVLNTIEFWSGTNPLHAGTKTIKGQDGRLYAVKTMKNGYEIKSPDGEISYFIHDKKNDSWSLKQNGEVREIFRFNEDGTIKARLMSGQTIDVTNDEAGLNQVREAAMGDQLYYAFN